MAYAAVEAAIAEAEKRDGSIAVAVVDPFMRMVAFARMTNAVLIAGEIVFRKAASAVAFGMPTGWMPEQLAGPFATTSDGLVTNMPGGAPIYSNGVLIGALGVAGLSSEPDKAVAEAAVAALGLESQPRR